MSSLFFFVTHSHISYNINVETGTPYINIKEFLIEEDITLTFYKFKFIWVLFLKLG